MKLIVTYCNNVVIKLDKALVVNLCLKEQNIFLTRKEKRPRIFINSFQETIHFCKQKNLMISI